MTSETETLKKKKSAELRRHKMDEQRVKNDEELETENTSSKEREEKKEIENRKIEK